MGISKAILRILCRNEKPWEEEDSSNVFSVGCLILHILSG